jgi:SNF2 family DNA or RNA helicase
MKRAAAEAHIDTYIEAARLFHGGDIAGAKAVIEDVLRRDPGNRGANLLMLDICSRTNDSDRMLVHLYNLVTDREFREEIWNSIVSIHDSKKHYGEIIRFYDTHLKALNPAHLNHKEQNRLRKIKEYVERLRSFGFMATGPDVGSNGKPLRKRRRPREQAAVRTGREATERASTGREAMERAGASPLRESRQMILPLEIVQHEAATDSAALPLADHREITTDSADLPLPEHREIALDFNFDSCGVLERIEKKQFDTWEAYDLRIRWERVSLLEGFDSLLCLSSLVNVENYWYQTETVKRVLKHFRGRVLLCDEVGLGKTIEACILLKEYHMRGLAGRILILTPPSLVSQWREELSSKFGMDFATTDDPEYHRNPEWFWTENPRIIASFNTAKSRRNFENVTSGEYDLVIIDEAHHFKNRSSANWKLGNALKKKFIFLLTATPVQNDLVELYNLITLLRPGTLGTPAGFRREFVSSADPTNPRNVERLRELVRQVMVRNTRALVDVSLPPRSAVTVGVKLEEAEKELYQQVGLFARRLCYEGRDPSRMLSTTLLMEAGSSPFAVIPTIRKLETRRAHPGQGFSEEGERILSLAQTLKASAKAGKLLHIVRADSRKKIVFVRYAETLKYLAAFLEERGISFALFHGGLTSHEKDAQMARFRENAQVLLSTEAGSEGKNLQFCQVIINYDLPWNPMKIEQRIGRIHRIGQKDEVLIFNLSCEGTLEDHILSVLDRKINMFQLVIGEIGMILGNLESEKEFEEIVMDIWMKSASPEQLAEGFERLGDDLVRAKEEYVRAKEVDDRLFAEDYIA